jgi:hypothetical protein
MVVCLVVLQHAQEAGGAGTILNQPFIKGMISACIWYGESFISLLATPAGAIGLLALLLVLWWVQIYDSSLNSSTEAGSQNQPK